MGTLKDGYLHAGGHPGFSQWGAIFFSYIVASRVQKKQPYLSSISSCRLPQSTHIAKSLKKQTSKMLIAYFNGRNPENIVFFRVLRGGGPLGPPAGVSLGTWLLFYKVILWSSSCSTVCVLFHRTCSSERRLVQLWSRSMFYFTVRVPVNGVWSSCGPGLCSISPYYISVKGCWPSCGPGLCSISPYHVPVNGVWSSCGPGLCSSFRPAYGIFQ